MRALWIVTAGTVSGCGIWATHFIAMLAYDPGVVIGYSLALTLLSLFTAALVTTFGFGVAARWSAPLGGAIIGGGIASMHYLGMASVELPARITWIADLVTLSIAFGVTFGAASLALAHRIAGRPAGVAASILFTAAILTLHFTAMGALEIVPDPWRTTDQFYLMPDELGIAIAGVTVIILGLSLTGSFIDRLHERDRRLAMAIDNMTQGVVLFDSGNRVIAFNDRYIEMYGLSRDVVRPGASLEAVIRHRHEIGALGGDPAAYCRDVLARIRAGRTVNRVVEHPDGRGIAVVNRPLANGDWIATHEDITGRRLADRRIEYLAHHDTLTGLPNRVAFGEYLAAALARARDQGQCFGLLCIDFDRFKEINDLFGHAIGDAFLVAVSARMSAAAEGNFIARLSGDEFAIVVTNGQLPENAAGLAGRLLKAVGGEVIVEHRALRVSMSVGVAIYPDHADDAGTLIANADAALYEAKARNRGTVRVFDAAIDAQRRCRHELQLDLRFAVPRNELSLHFQPQATAERQIVGFEALVRWQHPSRGMIMPDDFIALAEESSTIVEIGEWVLREACRQAGAWCEPLRVSVNVSPVQFRHGDLVQTVHAILIETGLAPGRLEIEITEGVLIDDCARALSVLRRLKAMGVRIALDDFGAGYSSLSYLQAFPFDKIKIDRAFISQLFHKREVVAIVRAVVGLAHALRMRVVAEGVETEDQFDVLARESCDELQGYLIGRPQPVEAYARVLGTPQERAVAVA
jgi:diguanylate cyclase (GGDEF)-like protein